jgi:hypothetical protein
LVSRREHGGGEGSLVEKGIGGGPNPNRKAERNHTDLQIDPKSMREDSRKM